MSSLISYAGPANSRLDNEKLRRAYGLELPDWRKSLTACCVRLIP